MPGLTARAATAALTALAVSAAAQVREPLSLDALLARVTTQVERYYTRAQNIVCLETVRVQPLRRDLLADGFPRRLKYELRIAWESADASASIPEASVVRRLLAVGGRPPDPDDEPGCMDPRDVSPEPLSMLLPEQRGDYVFTEAGTGRTGGREAIRFDFRSAEKGDATVTWHDECVSISLPGRSAGRVWVDAATYDVLRLDEHLVGQFDFRVPPEQTRLGASTSMVIERSDSTIRYEPVTFTEPDETLMLPKSIERLQVIRGAGVPRVRISQTYSDYQRFLTDAHIVTTPRR